MELGIVDKMNVLIVASEMSPFAKTGGLGDVIGSLPKEIRKKDVDVRVVLPKYKTIKKELIDDVEFVETDVIKMGFNNRRASIYKKVVDNVTIYFVENDYYFNRDGLYGYEDDYERFAFFTKVAIEMLPSIKFRPDVINFNDWQTSLGPLYIKEVYNEFLFYKNIKSVVTIHNIQYQGNFGTNVLNTIGVPSHLCGAIEHYGNINYLKAGLVFADAISTVSETYAMEIQTSRYGYGLEGVLRERVDVLYGIVNGIDTSSVNPKTNTALFQNFDKDSIELKKVNKQKLQEKLNLPVCDLPIIAMITRLADQKGLDLLAREVFDFDAQFVILGTGDGYYEHMLRNLQNELPHKVSANIFFDEDLATQIYSGSDMFLMPSLFEPCGLGQIFAMRYGTVPIVRATGGLIDTVEMFDEDFGSGNGFLFNDYDVNGLKWAVGRCIDTYHSDNWGKVVYNAMNTDFSWEKSACKYIQMYEDIM